MAGKKAKGKGLSPKAKKWIAGISIGALVVVLCSFGVQLNKLDKTNELNPTFGYEQGLLSTTDGGEVKGTTSIRSKDFISVDEFKCDLTDEASITYRLFWYNESEEFVSVSEELTTDFTDAAPEGAEKVRIQITPVNDPEVSATEIAGYAGELTVTWAK